MSIDITKLKFFAKFIEDRTGIVYSESNYFQLEHRLNDVATLYGLAGLNELWVSAQTGIDERLRNMLLDHATNNETSFFRDASVFEALVRDITPALVARASKSGTIRIWSAAGSTGQEAYSIAMALDQARKKDPSFPDFDILVSDISERVLARAKEGRYSKLEIQRGLAANLALEYFENQNEDCWRVKSSLSSKLRFQSLNLLEPFPSNVGVFDIVFCRNVLIYQSVENKVQVIEKFLKHISAEGYLILGAAESMLGLSAAFQQQQFGTAVVYKKI